jgi:hypothetical protein
MLIIYRASFGTTKYCSFFLRNLPCTNPECMYLHELGGDRDSFTKEDMALGYVFIEIILFLFLFYFVAGSVF